MSFRFKIISLILLVGLVPYIVIMVYSGNILRNEYYLNTQKRMQTQLTLSVERIDQFLTNLHRDMSFITQMDVMNDIFSKDVDRRISQLLEKKKTELKLEGDFYLLDVDGIVIASSDLRTIHQTPEITPFYSVDVKSPFDDQIIATLIVNFSLKNILKFFDNNKNRHYYLIADGKTLFKNVDFTNKINVSRALKTKPDIRVVLEENQDEFLQLLGWYERLFILVLLIGAVIISIIAYYFLNKLIRPVIDLSELVERVTITRDYSQTIAVKGRDEIAKLAKAFAAMLHGINNALTENEKLNKEIEDTQKEVVFTMGAIGESRSKETGNHVKRVAEYSRLLARLYGLNEREAELVKQASPMHDIGKVAIPDAVLNKPGRFNAEERAIMDTHARLGYEMLCHSERDLLKAAAIIAHEHHEKYDGSGYPRGLSGEDIHIYGRITAVADVFDALGSDRVYKKAWDDERIFKLFRDERGKHFDPKLIDLFFSNLDQFFSIREKFRDV